MDVTERLTRANDAPERPDARYVLVWTQQTLRSQDNPLLQAALQAGRRLSLPQTR